MRRDDLNWLRFELCLARIERALAGSTGPAGADSPRQGAPVVILTTGSDCEVDGVANGTRGTFEGVARLGGIERAVVQLDDNGERVYVSIGAVRVRA